MNKPTGTGESCWVGHLANDLQMQHKTIEGWVEKHAANVLYQLHGAPAQQLGSGFRQGRHGLVCVEDKCLTPAD